MRGTGVTEYLRYGGTLETAARIARHASTSTTQRYDRTDVAPTPDEIERIPIRHGSEIGHCQDVHRLTGHPMRGVMPVDTDEAEAVLT